MKSLLDWLKKLPHILVMTLLIVAMWLYSAYLFAAEEYYFFSLGIAKSDHTVEAKIDDHFDDALSDADRSTSEKLFGEQSFEGPIFTGGKGYQEGNWLIEGGLVIVPKYKIVGHSDLGTIHVDTNRFGLFVRGGYELGRVTALLGAQIIDTRAGVHSYLHDGKGGVLDYHDKLKDISTDLDIAIRVEIYNGTFLECAAWRHVGDVDWVGSDTIKHCGVGVTF
ncbi:MAG: hypothetical protein N0C84_17000 [Candidatus Thiodiazotropha taylori]|uniref:Uncharacterized protein n=1 Tax=Candidatus Thiodiazotropha taylori TaxID=2792791 RepID=A0A9E4N5V6_9GAMM|nr:hypothetical protein [Candidatus Thiodiazotropha taylori]MCW4258165.1 hypothetical protein [Candidatus Thiodiazotropha taylori]